MQIVYIHGFESNEKSIKGQWIEEYCSHHHPKITVHRPNFNMPPLEVMQLLKNLIAQDHQTMVIGSSLGGFFATACVAQHNVPAVLINPSTRPFESLQRFDNTADKNNTTEVVHTTEDGWEITRQHFADLQNLYHAQPVHAEKMMVLLKTGDEVINYRLANEHYQQTTPTSTIVIDEGGDHFMHDMQEKLPLMLKFLCAHYE